MEDLKVVVAADIGNFKKGMDEVQKELAQTALAGGKLDSTLKKSSAGFTALSQSTSKLSGGVAKASSALNTLAAVIPGVGIGSLALLIAGPLISAFQEWIIGIKRVSESQKALAKIRDEVSGQVATELLNVTKLKAVLDSENTSRLQKLTALKQLKQANPDYFGQLDIEHGKVKGLELAYDLWTASILRSVGAKVSQKSLEAAFKKRQDLVDKLRADVEDAKVDISNLTEFQVQDISRRFNIKGVIDSQKLQIIAEILQSEKDIRAKTKDVADTIQDAFVPKPEKLAKGVKTIETISDVLKKAEHDVKVLGELGDILGLNKATEQVNVLKSALSHLLDAFPDSGQRQGAVIKFTTEIDEIELRENLLKTVANIKTDNLASIPLDITPPKASQLASTIKNVIAPISKELEAFRESVASLMTNIVDNIAASFASLVTGTGGLQQALQSVLGLVGQFLIDFGKGIIKAGLLAQAIKKIAAAPGAGIAVGIAAIVLGNILKSVSLPRGFSTGGFVSGPGTAKSDSIPARLSNGEYVMSASTVSRFGKSFFDMINSGGRPRNGGFADGGPVGGIGGGQLITVEVVGRLRGKDIYFTNIRAGQTIGRNG